MQTKHMQNLKANERTTGTFADVFKSIIYKFHNHIHRNLK